jgi:hypothetical protein
MHVITRQDRSSESLVLPPPSTSLGPSSAQSPSSSYTRRALLSRSTHHTTPPSPLNPVNGIFCNRTETNYHSTPRERAEHNKAQGRDGSAEAAVPPAAALALSSCLRWQPTGTGCHRSNTYVRDDVNIIQKTPHGVPASQVEAVRTYANVRYFALLMYSESMILTRRSSERRHGLTHTRRLLAATSLQTSSRQRFGSHARLPQQPRLPPTQWPELVHRADQEKCMGVGSRADRPRHLSCLGHMKEDLHR